MTAKDFNERNAMSDLFAAPTTQATSLTPMPSLASEAASTGQALDVVDTSTVVAPGAATFMQKFADSPEKVAILRAEARRVLPELFNDSTKLIEYGTDVLEDVVRVTQRALELTRDVQLPGEEDAALRDLKVQLGKVSGYDMSVAENLKRYREMKAKIGKFIGGGKAKTYFEAFKADRMTLEQLTNEMSGDLMEKSRKRGLMAKLTGETYRVNLESLYALKERVAILEAVRELAVAERAKYPQAVPVDDPNAETVGALDKFMRLLDMKITDFAGRWLIGVGMSPMLRAQQEQEEVMALVLYNAATTGMEKLSFIVSRYAASLSLQADVDTIDKFRTLDNQLTQQVFTGMRETIAQAATIATTPSMTEETITHVATQVSGMITDVQTAYANARVTQAKRLEAIDTAAKVIHEAQSSGQPVNLQQVSSVVASGRATKSLTAGVS